MFVEAVIDWAVGNRPDVDVEAVRSSPAWQAAVVELVARVEGVRPDIGPFGAWLADAEVAELLAGHDDPDAEPGVVALRLVASLGDRDVVPAEGLDPQRRTRVVEQTVAATVLALPWRSPDALRWWFELWQRNGRLRPHEAALCTAVLADQRRLWPSSGTDGSRALPGTAAPADPGPRSPAAGAPAGVPCEEWAPPPAAPAASGDAGSRPDPAASAAATATAVRLGASAPRCVRRGRPFVVRLVAYAPELESAARRCLERTGRHRRVELAVHETRWAVGEAVTVRCAAPGVRFEVAERCLVWNGGMLDAVFDGCVDAEEPPRSTIIRLSVGIAGVPVAEVRLEMGVRRALRRRRTVADAVARTTAFASYARSDSDRVLDMVRAVKVAAGLDVFVDCLDLRASEAWKDRLRAEITDRDLFLLYWSTSASRSPWVAWEIETVLAGPRPDAVSVTPLERGVAPHPALAHLHHGDPSLALRREPPD